MKILPNEITGTQTSFSINFGGKLSFMFHPVFSFFLSASTASTYISTAPTCTTTIITLKLCALNAEFQHFILIFFLKIPYFADTTEREDRGESRPKERVTLPITLMGN
jgi:hypothetical protein